jgi:Fur family transcriptional regulator, ferric uptake regulator
MNRKEPLLSGQILALASLKRTRGRMRVLDLLLRSAAPLSQPEILTHKKTAGMDRVSIYRTLQAFLSKGIAHRVDVGDRLWRFAVCRHTQAGHAGHCHPHFTCKYCGAVECLPQLPLPSTSQVKTGYLVEEQEFYLKGRCARCSP